MPGVPHECLISQANSLEKKALLKTHQLAFSLTVEFLYQKHTVNMFESPGVGKAWDSMKTKVR